MTASIFVRNVLKLFILLNPGLIILNFLVSMMTEILLIGCFLSHTIQFNVLCVFLLTFRLSMCYFMTFTYFFIVILMRSDICLIEILCMYVQIVE